MTPATRSRLEAELDKQKHDEGFMGSITAFSEGWRKACEALERILCDAAPTWPEFPGNYVTHPQSVWFKTWWLPVLEQNAAQIAGLRAQLETMKAVHAEYKHGQAHALITRLKAELADVVKVKDEHWQTIARLDAELAAGHQAYADSVQRNEQLRAENAELTATLKYRDEDSPVLRETIAKERARAENSRFKHMLSIEKQDLANERDTAVADCRAMAECLGMLDAIGLPEPYDRHVREALTKERVERYLK